ncbi:hypothetical protein FF38_02455 [Lucilia cuprina]|uniref:Uncharacterized protein n=1 Tax=Lucilia cuprina TaxID=7375 RepID=A0A0L0CAJ2_LUCCU|nr:hypothetical protein FF38_02455 [Lucilia cuprina]
MSVKTLMHGVVYDSEARPAACYLGENLHLGVIEIPVPKVYQDYKLVMSHLPAGLILAENVGLKTGLDNSHFEQVCVQRSICCIPEFDRFFLLVGLLLPSQQDILTHAMRRIVGAISTQWMKKTTVKEGHQGKCSRKALDIQQVFTEITSTSWSLWISQQHVA